MPQNPLFSAIQPKNPWAEDFYGPVEPQPAPAPLTGWRKTVDDGINGLVGGFKGLTGLGDQGPPGMTAINFGQVLGAVAPFIPGKLKLPRFAQPLEGAYQGPTVAGKVAQPFYSRLDEAAAQLPNQTFGPRIAAITKKGLASQDEMIARKVPEFVAAAGNKPVTKAAFDAHLAANPVPQVKVTTLRADPSRKAFDDFMQEMEVKHGPGVSWDETTFDEADTLRYDGFYNDLKSSEHKGPEFPEDTYRTRGGTDYQETLFQHAPETRDELIAKWERDARSGNNGTYSPGELDAALGAMREGDYNGLLEETRRPVYKDGHYGQYPDTFAHTRSGTHEVDDPWTVADVKVKKPLTGGPGEWYVYSDTDAFKPAIIKAATAEEAAERGVAQRNKYEPRKLKGTHVYENQSDAHQAGGKIGYQSAELQQKIEDLRAAHEKATGEARRLRDASARTPSADASWAAAAANNNVSELYTQLHKAKREFKHAVPDLPFKDDKWTDLQVKHHLFEAASKDHDFVSFSDAKTQIDRWGSQRLQWKVNPEEHGGGFNVNFEPQVGGDALGGDMGQLALERGLIKNWDNHITSEEQLKGLLEGSDVDAARAWKRMNAAPEGTYLPRAEGMQMSYGDKLPKTIHSIVSKLGGVVEKSDLVKGVGTRPIAEIEAEMARVAHILNQAEQHPSAKFRNQTHQKYDPIFKQLQDEKWAFRPSVGSWRVRLTPELKKRLLDTGLPFMAGAAAVETRKDK